MRTIYFPEKEALIEGVGSRSERSAYLDAIAILQEVSALTETYSPVNRDAVTAVAHLTQKTRALGGHLTECSQKVFSVSTYGQSRSADENLADEVERLHLRQSMRERFVDLAVQIDGSSMTELSLGYDAAELEHDALLRDVTTMRDCNFPDVAIMRTLGVDYLPQSDTEVGRTSFHFQALPEYPNLPLKVYSHINSKGLTYYLHETIVELRGGRPQVVYFFAKVPNNGKGLPVSLPNDRVVKENPRNGFLSITKKK